MDTNYKYYKEITGELVRVHIEQDITPENPRYDWDGNIGHMMCWHRDYQLGDYKENSYSDNLDFLNNLLRAIRSCCAKIRKLKPEYKQSSVVSLQHNWSACCNL